jgi:hypothetical protein
VAYFLKKSPVTDAIQKAFKKEEPAAFWRHYGHEIFARLMAELGERGAKGSALISHEDMSAPKIFASQARLSKQARRDPSFLAAHLSECRKAALQAGFADVKVIMGIRRQDQYLGSRYAQHGELADEPGQLDFEQQILEVIDPARRYFVDGVWLDYKMTRDLIANIIGVDAVLVLPLEQLSSDPSSYFAALEGFLGEAIAVDRNAGRRENVRSVESKYLALQFQVAAAMRDRNPSAPGVEEHDLGRI